MKIECSHSICILRGRRVDCDGPLRTIQGKDQDFNWKMDINQTVDSSNCSLSLIWRQVNGYRRETFVRRRTPLHNLITR